MGARNGSIIVRERHLKSLRFEARFKRHVKSDQDRLAYCLVDIEHDSLPLDGHHFIGDRMLLFTSNDENLDHIRQFSEVSLDLGAQGK